MHIHIQQPGEPRVSDSTLPMSLDTETSARLMALPTELLEQITGYLNDEVLTTLRLTCKALNAAIFNRFCEAYVTHLGCWIFSKDRWERLHNLLSLGSTPLTDRIQTITFTMDELELLAEPTFDSVTGYNHPHLWATEYRNNPRELHMEQYNHVNDNISIEADAVNQRGPADSALMLRVLHQAKLHGCFIRLECSPANPAANKMPPLNSHAKEVHRDLQRAIAQVNPLVESISIDRTRHKDLVEALADCEDEAFESFASLREFTMTPMKRDSRNVHKDKKLKYDVIQKVFARAHSLRKVYLHVPSHFGYARNYGRAQVWTPDLLLSNRLGSLEHLTLMYVPLSQNSLIEILRRCSGVLTYCKLVLDEKASPAETWLELWEQLASMDRLCHLELYFPDFWCSGESCSRFSKVEDFGINLKEVFVGKGGVREGLARIMEAERSLVGAPATRSHSAWTQYL